MKVIIVSFSNNCFDELRDAYKNLINSNDKTILNKRHPNYVMCQIVKALEEGQKTANFALKGEVDDLH